MRVAVIGGGAVGLVVAGDLADRADVTLYERDALGSGSTGRAAGLCYDAFADDVDAAVATRALDRYREWDLLEPCPYVWLAREDADARAVREQVDGMQANGVAAEYVDPATLGERYPAIATEDVVAAGVATAAGLVDPAAVVDALADRARRAGVTVETETPVDLEEPTTVSTPGGVEQFDAVVVAAGPATAEVVGSVSVALSLKTYRAQALVTDAVGAALPSVYDATEQFYWRPKGDGVLVGDGAHEVDAGSWSPEADRAFVTSTLEKFADATTLSPDCARAWAGLCTATPDRDPLVGRVADGLWVATGWQGHGLMRAPATGEYLANRLLGAETGFSVPLADRVDPTRFDGTETFDALGDPTRDW
jgi:sarcosine oxidase subunit beta